MAALEAELKVVPVIYVEYRDELDERRAIIEFNRYRIKNGLQLHNEIIELANIKEEAKKRQQEHGNTAPGRPKETLRDNCPEVFKPAKDREHAPSICKSDNCKYSYKDVPRKLWVPGDGVWMCPGCGYGIAPFEDADFVDKEAQRSRDIIADTIGLGNGKQVYKLEYIAEHKPDLLSKINGKQGKSINSAYVSARRDVVKEEVKTAVIPTGMYRVIYADPPWRYGNTQPDYHEVQDDHYPTMTVKEICDLEIGDRKVAEMAPDDAVLFLWATSPILEESFEVIKAWGFKYKASFVWDKIKHNMGHYNSVRHEFLLICVRGSCQPDENQLFDSVQSIERTEHSAKPEAFRNIIQTLYPYGTRIELFARKQTVGWEVFGNDIH